MTNQVTIIEIGSSKVVCLVAHMTNGELVISGAGFCGYPSGYRYDMYKGAYLPDEKELSDAVKRALRQVEYDNGRVERVYIAVGVPFLKTVVTHGEIAVRGKHKFVEEEDEFVLERISRRSTDQPGYSYIHSTPISFEADGEESVNLPIGKKIEKSLSAYISHVFIDNRMEDLLQRIFKNMDIKIEAFVATPLAEAGYLAPRGSASNGKIALLVDVGHTHTDLSVVKNETICSMKSLPIGGRHFTSDIAVVTEITASAAENIKRHYKFGLDYTGTTETIKTDDDEVKYIDKHLCSQIIEARMDELCDHILDYVDDMELDPESTDIYITGGGALMMQDAEMYMANYMGMHIVVNIPHISRKQLNTPNNVSAFAVASFVLTTGFFSNEDIEEEPARESFFSKLFKK